jgi:hypothetical protein
MKMRTIIFIAILMFGCKKKDVGPEPEPVRMPPVIQTDTCKVSDAKFAGKYTYNSDTINVVFIKNNCPIEYSNTYEVKNFKQAMAAITPTDVTITGYFTTKSEEKQGKMYDGLKQYNFFLFGDTTMRLVTSKLMSSQIDFKRVK